MSPEQARLRIWLYRRTAPGEFVPIPIKTWDRWADGRIALARCEDGFVWHVSVSLWTSNRKVVDVHAIDFSKSRVNAAGFREAKMRHEELAVALNTLSPLKETRPTATVVDAENRFAQRQFRWKPAAEDLRALHDIVNRRAGRRVMPEAD